MTSTPGANERIEEIVDVYRSQIHDSRLYFRPDIPAKKLKNALAGYAKGVAADDVLVLADDTVMGSGKDGGLLTHTGLFGHELAVSPKHIDYAAIEALECVNMGAGSVVKVNGEKFLPLEMSQREANRLFADLISDLAVASGAHLVQAPAGTGSPTAPTPAPRPDRREAELAEPERLLALLPFAEIEHAFKGNESFAVIITNHRIVLAKHAKETLKLTREQAYSALKAEKKSIFGPETGDLKERMSRMLAERYRQMTPDAALREAAGSLAIATPDVTKVEVAAVRLGNPLSAVLYPDLSQQGAPDYTLLVISTGQASYVLQVRPHWDVAAEGWGRALEDLFGHVVVWNGVEPD
jgi:hypothetical protein